MITQRDLRKVEIARQKAGKLSQDPAVIAFHTAEQEAAELLAALRQRYEAGDSVEPGRLKIVRDVKASARVAWEKVLTAFKQLPAIAKVVAKDAEAKQLLDLVAQKSAASPYVSVSNSVTFDVVPSG